MTAVTMLPYLAMAAARRLDALCLIHCPPCGELRKYRPSEVFLGMPDQLVTRQQRVARK